MDARVSRGSFRRVGLVRPPPFWGVAAGMFGAVLLIGGLALWYLSWHFYPLDTLAYYLAGARLNDGHRLYDLSPGDAWLQNRPEFNPKLPLFSPPLIAVLWRPLAAIPGQVGMLIWIVAMAFTAMYAVSLSVMGTRGWGGLLVAALMPSLVLLIGVGNVDAVLLLGTIAVWMLIASGRDREAGIIVGIIASLKVTPGILLVWFVLTGRWRAAKWTLGAGAVCAVISILGTSPDIFFRYLRVVGDASSTGRWWAFGVLILGLVVIWRFRRRPSVSFVIAVVLMPVASPVAAIHSWSLLLGVLAPWLSFQVGRFGRVAR
jgi:MYXO-CTERM domain-containing protein